MTDQSSPETAAPFGYLMGKAGVNNGYYFITPAEFAHVEGRFRNIYKPIYSAPAQCTQWQPIETAPKEGRFLICGRWLGEEFVTEARTCSPELWRHLNPTHWSPMPTGSTLTSTDGKKER